MVLSRSERQVLSAIRTQGVVTRSTVASRVGLSLAMTTRITARLQELGLIREAGRVESAGPGRQAVLLEVCPDAAYVIGMDIGTQIVHILVSDLHGARIWYREVPSDVLYGLDQPAIVIALARLLGDAIQEAELVLEEIAVLGVALTGVVDSDRGVCLIRSNTPGWENFPIGPLLEAAVGRPVILEETARAKSIAEMQVGAARGADHFLYVDMGAAVGASIVMHGQPFRGVSGLAGELGHVTVDPDGPFCRCGNRGCVQATASAQAVLGRARRAVAEGVYSILSTLGDTLTLQDLAAAATAGDKLALSLLNEAGEQLGEAISMALNILGLDLVVLGGALVTSSPVVLEAAIRTVQLRVLPIIPRRRTLVATGLGSDGGARGVALQSIAWLFDHAVERLVPRPAEGRCTLVAGAR